MNKDKYYERPEVSNSDLTALKNEIYPRPMVGNRERAFRFGSIVDVMVTERHRVDFLSHAVDGEPVDAPTWEGASLLLRSLRHEATRDAFLREVLDTADTQVVSVRHGQEFENGGFRFSLDTRCKWDWWLGACGFGGDLKTTAASTESEFLRAVDFFDWDRSRAWYMDVAGSDRDFIYAVSKRNGRVFRKLIRRGDGTYLRGREKYEELAFKYWCYMT